MIFSCPFLKKGKDWYLDRRKILKSNNKLKKQTNMNKCITLVVSLFLVLQMNAQKCGKECCCKSAKKAAMEWAKKGEWRNGFTKASPDKSVNLVTFQKQYAENPE